MEGEALPFYFSVQRLIVGIYSETQYWKLPLLQLTKQEKSQEKGA